MTTYPNQTVAAVAETTPAGVAYERATVTTSTGDPALLAAPASKPMGSSVTLVIACHGFTGSNNTFELHAPSLGIRDRMTDDGYLFMSPHMHGNTWGNQVAMNDLKAVYDYANTHWRVDHVLLFGGSMGGLTVANAAARGAVPKVRGVVAVAPAVNLADAYSRSANTDSIAAAYGIAPDGSDYATKTAGSDPVLHSPSQYADGRFRFYHSPADATVTKAAHSDLFVSNGLTAQMADFQLLTMTGGHLDAGNYDPADTSAFYAAALAVAPAPPPPVEEPVTPGAPVTIHAVKAWDGAGWVQATPRVYDGSAWAVVTPTGYVPA